MATQTPPERFSLTSAGAAVSVLANLAGALALAATFAYVTGAASLLIYFERANVPAIRSLTLQDPRFVIATGVTTLILPAIVVGVLILFLARMFWGASDRGVQAAEGGDQGERLSKLLGQLNFTEFIVAVFLISILLREAWPYVLVNLVVYLGLASPWGLRAQQWINGPLTSPPRLWRLGLIWGGLVLVLSLALTLINAVPLTTAAVKTQSGAVAKGYFVAHQGNDWYIGENDTLTVVPATDEAVKLREPQKRDKRPSVAALLSLDSHWWSRYIVGPLLVAALALALNWLVSQWWKRAQPSNQPPQSSPGGNPPS